MKVDLSEMGIYTEEEVSQNFEEVADEVDNVGPVKILTETGSALVMMSWQYFLDNYKDVLTQEESEKLRELGEGSED